LRPTDCVWSPTEYHTALQGNFPGCRRDDVTKETVERRDAGLSFLGTTLRSSWSLLMTFSQHLVTGKHTWVVSMTYKLTTWQRFVPLCFQSSLIYLFTFTVTKLINLLSARIDRKQNGLRCVVLSWHSIKTEWLSALRGMHDLCLKEFNKYHLKLSVS